MKNLMTAFLLAAVSAGATDLTKVKFTRSDGSIYETKVLTPYPAYCGTNYLGTTNIYSGVNGIGTKTNSYNQVAYHIDISKNELILGDGFEVGVLLWNGNVVDVGTHYGVAIDNRGRMWLATNANDGDSQYYLFIVDLSTATVTFVDYLDFGYTTFPVNGMIVSFP